MVTIINLRQGRKKKKRAIAPGFQNVRFGENMHGYPGCQESPEKGLDSCFSILVPGGENFRHA